MKQIIGMVVYFFSLLSLSWGVKLMGSEKLSILTIRYLADVKKVEL